MLIEFSLGNFWSFNEIQTLHMQAAAIKSKFPKVDQENLFEVEEDFSLLKSKAIFGANGSGKSNLVKGFYSMIVIISDCLKDDQILSKMIFHFLLQRENFLQPSFFQISFVTNGVQYRYGFEADRKRITSEWLFGKPLKKGKRGSGIRERYYFTREGDDIKVNEKVFKEAVQFVPKKNESVPLYRENVLFLTLVSAFNGPISKEVRDYFLKTISLSSGLEDPRNWIILLNVIANDPPFADRLTHLLQSIDPSISKVEFREIPKEQLPTDLPLVREPKPQEKVGTILINRSIKNGSGKKANLSFVLDEQEAEGTKKLATLSPHLFYTLDHGGLLIVDEFDARLHPNLSRKIIELFHSPKTNPHNAQLVFVSHDSNLLDARLLRRDQIAFTKKDQAGATELYSLAEFKGVRNDSSFEKDYLMGKYNAVPHNLNALERAIENFVRHE